jgi:hypothetical protein
MQRPISFAIAFIVVGVLAPIAQGQETTVVFDGTVNFVADQSGVTVDDSIEAGTTRFHGTYTLGNTALPIVESPGSPGFAFYLPLPFGQSTGSMQVGEFAVEPDLEPLGFFPIVIIQNDFLFPSGVADAWSHGPYQSSGAISGGHWCHVAFLKSDPPDRLSEVDYFVVDSLAGWGSAPLGGAGGLGCLAGTYADPGSPPLILGPIENILSGFNVDLKPGSDPNCVNPRSRGQVAVAIRGNAEFDVQIVEEATVQFAGASAVGCNLEDIAPADGFPDLVCHFLTQEADWPAPGSNCSPLMLTGDVYGIGLQGSDYVCLAGETTCEAATSQ